MNSRATLRITAAFYQMLTRTGRVGKKHLQNAAALIQIPITVSMLPIPAQRLLPLSSNMLIGADWGIALNAPGLSRTPLLVTIGLVVKTPLFSDKISRLDRSRLSVGNTHSMLRCTARRS